MVSADADASTASVADAAATIVANAVDADDPRIRRAAANRVRDDSDLGERLVTCDVPPLPGPVLDAALAAGADEAEAQIEAGRVVAAALCLQGRVRTLEAAAAFDTLVHRPAAPRFPGAAPHRRPTSTRI